jgi:tetratricopeptide (TPR) repeat protein
MTASPAAFAVTLFENHVPDGRALDWIVAEAPFEIAEKTQAVLGLTPLESPLFVSSVPVAAEADVIAPFARDRRAQFVITGWFDRIGEELRIAVLVWRVDKNARAVVIGDAKNQGAMPAYHAILGRAVADAWAKAGFAVDAGARERFGRPLSTDIYPVFVMGRGLGYLLAGDLKSAEHDLERSVFLNPKLFEAQRLLGELYVRRAQPRDAARAAAKFNYALELAPDNVPAQRAAANAASTAGQWERALELWSALVTQLPWDLDARFQLGRAYWQLGSADAAERQLQQVVARKADLLAARHILVLIHASRGDTKRLAAELELIAMQAPRNLEVQSDLAAAYGALGRWDQAAITLEALAQARPNDFAVLLRAGDAQRRRGQVEAAIGWYERAARLAPESSMPGFLIGQVQFDSGNLVAASATYLRLQRFGGELASAAHALGTIAFLQRRFDDASRHFFKAVRIAPRNLASRRAIIATELQRNDLASALQQLEPALAAWPDDGALHYLAGMAYRWAGNSGRAHSELYRALEANVPAARLALAASDLPPHSLGGSAAHLGAPEKSLAREKSLPRAGADVLNWQPELMRPWGDSEALQEDLRRFAAAQADMATVREAYQGDIVALLGALGKGPGGKRKAAKGCPTGQLAARWADAQTRLQRLQRLGLALEAAFARIVRHDELGMTAGLLPNARLAVASAKRDYPVALRDMAELRAEWSSGLSPELGAAGCTMQALAAAASDRRNLGVADEPLEPEPVAAPERVVQRTTFFVDNTRCSEELDVYVDDALVGRTAAGQRTAWVAGAGERSLCMIVPGTGQCGDRGTVRRVYLHDGWTVTTHCAQRP